MAETPEAAEVDAVSKTLLFWLDGHYYAVPADRVVKVIASPLMTRLPFLPAAARGVVAIGGKIVPVLDLRVLLGLPEGGEADGELVLISTGGETYALCADHVSQIVAGVWTGIVSWRGAPVHRLDVDALLAQSLRDNPAARMRLASLDVMQNRHQASGEAPAGCAAALLAVETAHAYVFLSLDAVVELCDTLPVAAVPDPAPHFVGAAFHRDALLPVICLDALLGHPPSDVQDRGSFIIVEVDRRRCALAVKRVIGLSREAEQGRIVPLRSLLAKLLPEPASGDAPTLPQAVARGADETPYLLVELAGQTCGFALSSGRPYTRGLSRRTGTGLRPKPGRRGDGDRRPGSSHPRSRGAAWTLRQSRDATVYRA